MTTQITDSMSMAVTALDAMDNHAALVREVAMRLLSEHAGGLPELIGVRMNAGANGPRLTLQPRTNEAAAQWAQALGVTLTESFAGDRDGSRQWHMSGDVVVDGVRVHVGACEWVPSCTEEEDVTPQVEKLRALLAGQRAALEDPHDGPLAHRYRVGRDLPETGGAK